MMLAIWKVSNVLNLKKEEGKTSFSRNLVENETKNDFWVYDVLHICVLSPTTDNKLC